MSFLGDTNVFGELAKPKPEQKVVEWLRKNQSPLYVSTVTIGELRRGIERLPGGKRKIQLQRWLESICDTMKGRVLSFNTSTTYIWG
jgi:predicted nucleic acid-binding protein